MKKQDILSRKDVELLVSTFYTKVRKHDVIGPIFNEVISDWNTHLSILSDFWETNLFFVKGYKGNPLKVHLAVDHQFNNEIQQAHFGHWLQLWCETLDELFDGKNKELAKDRARNMAHMLFMRIFQARKN